MLHPVRDDQLQVFSARFNEVFRKCQCPGNICFLQGISTHNGRLCVAMRFSEGSIGDRMARLKGGRLPLSDVLRYGADLPLGVLELHYMGIFVQNLQSCNFLLDDNDQEAWFRFIPYIST
ncbi:E3 ubiquitin-protein ligase KEG-like [Triticum dicoccoides]|uniref:E3 ubiquitin-protein ligase KEG-like n=1 Tax=Triticum dicoccoides TaxID=85692 RepID=UPI000E7B5D83|nr:E3 ubiquitin-protein ligase KEG-like [Triticum dicoccoides]